MRGRHGDGWKEAENGSHKITKIWDVLNVNANRMKLVLKKNTKMFESHISGGATEKLPGWEKLHAKTRACPMTWKDMLKNGSSGTVNWRTKKTEQL